jgi:hypothetical protein
MKMRIVALSACMALSAVPTHALAHGYYGYDAGDAALGGLVGGIVGGLIGSVIEPYPVYVRPAPVIVEPYGYGPPPAVYYRGGPRGWYGPRWREREWHDRGWRGRGHGWQGRRWRDDD